MDEHRATWSVHQSSQFFVFFLPFKKEIVGCLLPEHELLAELNKISVSIPDNRG